MSGNRPIVIVGPTASGKSDLALAIGASINAHIIAADAMQVYRRMDIGTAKPTVEEQRRMVHACIDLCEPSERFTVARYVEAYRNALARAMDCGAQPVVVGGTGLYITAVVDGLDLPGEWPDIREELERDPDTVALHARLAGIDPLAATRMEPTNRRRVVRALEVTLGSGRPFSSFGDGVATYPPTDIRQIGLRWSRPTLARRIESRVHRMVEAGLVDEVSALLAESTPMSATARQALGYKEIIEHLDGQISLESAIEKVVLRTRQFAVRQERWFRRDPRIEWFDAEGDSVEEIATHVLRSLA